MEKVSYKNDTIKPEGLFPILIGNFRVNACTFVLTIWTGYFWTEVSGSNPRKLFLFNCHPILINKGLLGTEAPEKLFRKKAQKFLAEKSSLARRKKNSQTLLSGKSSHFPKTVKKGPPSKVDIWSSTCFGGLNFWGKFPANSIEASILHNNWYLPHWNAFLNLFGMTSQLEIN